MKKNVLLLLLISTGLGALTTRNHKEMDLEKDLKDARVVRFSITLYRDEADYDQKTWEESVRQAAKAIESGSKENNDLAFVNDIADSLRSLVTRNSNKGVYGEIKVGIGDGSCHAECKDDCMCATRYNGCCPCSAISGSNCRSETLACNATSECCKKKN